VNSDACRDTTASVELAVHDDQHPKDREVNSQADEADSSSIWGSVACLDFSAFASDPSALLRLKVVLASIDTVRFWLSRTLAFLPCYSLQMDSEAGVSELMGKGQRLCRFL